MKLLYYILLLFLLSSYLGTIAQNSDELIQAKLDYTNRNFSNALPILEKEYHAKPTDASINFMYGVCLFETNQNLPKAEECLLYASRKNFPEALLFLGDLYTQQYQISEAKSIFERYAKLRPKEKDKLLGRLKKIDQLNSYITKTEDIQVIDSIVVDKHNFLTAYNLSPDQGQLLASFDNISSDGESSLNINGIQDKLYYATPISSKYSVVSKQKLIDGQFSNVQTLSTDNFGLTADTNYPYVMSDGVTLYFAGKDTNNIGGYDIYVTRLNINTGEYLSPQKLNMPFNSTANDYMFVIDETKGIGWFASDRFQPEGKVCIYTFIPNDHVKLVESEDQKYIEQRARLRSIKETQKLDIDYDTWRLKAKQKINKILDPKKEFTFIVNDKYTYNWYKDFKNTKARDLFSDAQKNRIKLDSLSKHLENMREEYIFATDSKKSSLKTSIIKMEKEISDLIIEIQQLENKSRNFEIQYLK